MPEKMEAKILLVDDEEQFLDVLSQRLESRGLKVDTATNGEDALRLADAATFDAIILDLAMPGIDGIETLKRIKEKHPDTEVIMLTGHATVKSGIDAMKLGAEDFLEKPFDLNELLAKIGEAQHKRMLVVEKGQQEEVRKIIKSKSW